MRYTINARPETSDTTPEDVAAVARWVEAAGFHACYLDEHPFPLVEGGYVPRSTAAHHTFDLFAMLGYLAGQTSSVLLQANAVVLPYRNPFLTAHAIATVDQASRGRVILGVAAGYHEPEFRALGVDFADRGRLTDEALGALKAAFDGRPVHLEGRGWKADGNTLWPLPVSQPHPPIWVGGNSEQAMRRAVKHGDGWCPVGVVGAHAGTLKTAEISSQEMLRQRISRLRELAEEAGRDRPLDVCFVRGALHWARDEPDAEVMEQLAELEDMGVTWCCLRLGGGSLERMHERIGAWGAALTRGE